MTTHNHELGAGSHDHHHQSKITNRYLGHLQIAVGAVFGSFSLLAAGVHNELDSPVHGLRGKAEHTSDRKDKLRLRIAAGALMIVGATGIYLLEKLVPVDRLGLVTPVVFGAETAVNSYNVYSHISSNSHSHDTKNGLRHNVIDAGSSLSAFTLTSVALLRGSEGELQEAIIGYGHVAAMVALGATSIIGAAREYHNPKDQQLGTFVPETP